jgi:two-component system KDP operon response regulator KdpE
VTVVLVVEDSEPLGRLLTSVLNRAGHQAVWAHTGARALEEAAALPPAVVLIDLHLGDMDGPDLAEILRRNVATARLVALSGEAPTQEVRRLFDDFLLKPVALDTLLGTISG